MKNFSGVWKATLLFVALLFGAQTLAFFYAPSFYFASLHQIRMPDFMVRAFLARFALVAGLYLVFSLLLAALNAWAWGVSKASLPFGARRLAGFFCLAMAQAFLLYGVCAWQFPSIFNFVPFWNGQALARSYLEIAMSGLGLFCIAAIALNLQSLRALACFVLIWWLPALLHLPLLGESALRLPLERSVSVATPTLLLLGFDAVDGDSGNAVLAAKAQNLSGRVFRQAFTPLPATHPAWNSILTGLYPERHGVRAFFDPPEASDNKALSLAPRWKEEFHGTTFFASDQPETSYFSRLDGFDASAFPDLGWRMHLDAIFLNHFVFPALWLNNRGLEWAFGTTLNSPSLFNFDLPRFFNFSFARFAALPSAARLMALHTCFLHSPIRLSRRELEAVPHWWRLSPRDFSYWSWSKPGDPLQKTPSTWHNPYFLRLPLALEFLASLVEEMKIKGYFAEDRIAFLSDHGERFVPGYEIYGGIHGIDLKTRRQDNVMLGIFTPNLDKFAVADDPVSLVDLSPSLLALSGAASKPGYDGLALFDASGKYLPPPSRPLKIESMGLITSTTWSGSFPQIPAEELESQVTYQSDGRIRVGTAYYRLLLERKEFLDVRQNPELLAPDKSGAQAKNLLGLE